MQFAERTPRQTGIGGIVICIWDCVSELEANLGYLPKDVVPEELFSYTAGEVIQYAITLLETPWVWSLLAEEMKVPEATELRQSLEKYVDECFEPV